MMCKEKIIIFVDKKKKNNYWILPYIYAAFISAKHLINATIHQIGYFSYLDINSM